MQELYITPVRGSGLAALRRTLAAFPVACFTLTAISDAAYLQTSNLLWLHFSEWLLFAGIVTGVLAAVVVLLELIVSAAKPSVGYLVGGLLVLVFAAANNFIHTADGWTAVMPYGITVSVLTVILMLATAWLGRRKVHHV